MTPEPSPTTTLEHLPDGAELHRRVTELLPIPRSLTGDGVRRTLDLLGTWCDNLTVHEVPTGTTVFDWEVPQEWNLRRATLTAPDGTVVADTDVHPLAVVGYSEPVSRRMTLEELQPHLHSLPDMPDALPYRTSYYARGWGFCLPHRVRSTMAEGTWTVEIDSTLAPGSLTYGEIVVPGRTPDVGLITAHTCHPGMANDNASGMVVATALTAHLQTLDPRLTWHVVLAPGTIGALVWLAANPDLVPRIRTGTVLAGIGDAGDVTVKRTRRGDTLTDRALSVVLRDRGRPFATVPFSPWGYDERQYGAPGFDLPVSLVMRTPHGTHARYHTSADDASFVRPASLRDSLELMVDVVAAVERNGVFHNTSPFGEPQLGRRGLYPSTGGHTARLAQLAMLWVLNLSDGDHDLLAIAERSGLTMADVGAATDALVATDLLEQVYPSQTPT